MTLTLSRTKELFTYQDGVLIRNKGTGGQPAGSVAGYQNEFGYVCIRIDNKEYRRSRLVWLLHTGGFPESEIDHINGIPSDDRFENLRSATRAENCQNRGGFKGNTSGVKGITWSNEKRAWIARIQANGKIVYLGRFENKSAAEVAITTARKTLHGEFARQ